MGRGGEHPRDELAAFALGILEPEERTRVEAHLDGCSSCRAEARSYEETMWDIAEASSLARPPAHIRERIVTRERSRARAPRVVRLGLGATLVDFLRRPMPLAIPLGLAAIIVFSAVQAAELRGRSDAYARALDGVVGARVVALAETGEAPGRGSLVIPSGGEPYLLLKLSTPPAGRTWQAWVLRGDVALPAGLAQTRDGIDVIVLTAPLSSGDGVAVTQELAAGAQQPTTKPVLLGRAG
ncbi:MAG: anti-sigma factor [Chloroflexota bacterium]|nr:anti-sigma factor [Chloroflexota bacterium]